jgi:hypothetical protein
MIVDQRADRGEAAAPTGRRSHKGRCRSRQALSDDEWCLIDDLLMQLDNVDVGHASAGFIAWMEARLQSVTADEAPRETLRALARRSVRYRSFLMQGAQRRHLAS